MKTTAGGAREGGAHTGSRASSKHTLVLERVALSFAKNEILPPRPRPITLRSAAALNTGHARAVGGAVSPR